MKRRQRLKPREPVVGPCDSPSATTQHFRVQSLLRSHTIHLLDLIGSLKSHNHSLRMAARTSGRESTQRTSRRLRSFSRISFGQALSNSAPHSYRDLCSATSILILILHYSACDGVRYVLRLSLPPSTWWMTVASMLQPAPRDKGWKRPLA